MNVRGLKGLRFVVEDFLFRISFTYFDILGLRLKDYGLGFKV